MTSPDSPIIAAATAVATVRDAQGDEAKPWGLRYGQVTATPSTTVGVIEVVLDGDTQAIETISLIGSNLAIGARVSVLGVPPSGNYIVATPISRAVNVFTQVIFTTTSTSYTATGAVFCGVVFTAPSSGRVKIHWSAEINGSTTATVCLVSPQVATGGVIGSGTVVTGWTANDDRQVRADVTTPVRSSDADIVDGLTPRLIYNVHLQHRVISGTGTIGRRRIVVSPVV